MKVTKQVEKLLMQGKKPRELVELGFSKSVVTKVGRQLRKQRMAERASNPKQGNQPRTHRQSRSGVPPENAALAQLQDEVDILKLWAFVVQLTLSLQGFACPQCVDGRMRWEEWKDGDYWDGAFVCEVCRYRPPDVAESGRLWEQNTK